MAVFHLNTRRLAILLVWAALMAMAARPIVLGIDTLRRPQQIRAERYDGVVPATGPYDPGEQQLVQMMLVRKANWDANRQERLDQALARRPIGIALIALGAGLMAAWTWLGWKLWSDRRPDPEASSAEC